MRRSWFVTVTVGEFAGFAAPALAGVRRGWRRIPVNPVTMAVGLSAFTAVTTPLWQPGQPTALVAAIGVLGGVDMAATVAAVSGAGTTTVRPRRVEIVHEGARPDAPEDRRRGGDPSRVRPYTAGDLQSPFRYGAAQDQHLWRSG